MAGCEFLEEVETSVKRKIGCPFLPSCDGTRCQNPDRDVRKAVAFNLGKFFTNEDAEQQQILETLQSLQYTKN